MATLERLCAVAATRAQRQIHRLLVAPRAARTRPNTVNEQYRDAWDFRHNDGRGAPRRFVTPLIPSDLFTVRHKWGDLKKRKFLYAKPVALRAAVGAAVGIGPWRPVCRPASDSRR